MDGEDHQRETTTSKNEVIIFIDNKIINFRKKTSPSSCVAEFRA